MSVSEIELRRFQSIPVLPTFLRFTFLTSRNPLHLLESLQTFHRANNKQNTHTLDPYMKGGKMNITLSHDTRPN